jgi:hypothetical protein
MATNLFQKGMVKWFRYAESLTRLIQRVYYPATLHRTVQRFLSSPLSIEYHHIPTANARAYSRRICLSQRVLTHPMIRVLNFLRAQECETCLT